MAAHRTLTEQEWNLLAEAEQRYYRGAGTHAYTDVNVREGDGYIAGLWAQASNHVENEFDRDEQEQLNETAARVAYALVVLAFGVEYAAEAAEAFAS